LKIISFKKGWTKFIAVVGACVALYLAYWLFPQKLQTPELRITDYLCKLRASRIQSQSLSRDDVIHVDAVFYANRTDLARAIRNLTELGVSAQVIDVVLANRIGEEEDQPLLDATVSAGNVYYGLSFGSGFGKQTTGRQSSHLGTIRYMGRTKWQVILEDDPGRLPVGADPQITYPTLATASRGLGFINLKPDPDGVLRRVQLLVRYRGAFYPSLAFRAVCDHLKVSPENIVVEPGESITLRIPNAPAARPIVIPIDENGNMLIDFSRPWDWIRHFSYSEILQIDKNPEKLEALKSELSGKIAMLSETVDNLFDVPPVHPHPELSSGVIQTLVMQNILTQSFIRPLSTVGMLAIELPMLVLLLVMGLRWSSLPLSLGAAALMATYGLTAVILLVFLGRIVDVVRPLATVICAWALMVAANSIQKAILLARTEEARRIAERDLEIGRQIQTGFFPTSLPNPRGWELEAHFQAARHVAGDFYDVFELQGGKQIALVIADVCDKGVGAALFMALFRSLIRVLSGSSNGAQPVKGPNSGSHPAVTLLRTIRSINTYIARVHERESMFATIFFGILNPQTGNIQYINAGHEPPIVIGAHALKATLAPTGPAVGLYDDLDFKVGQVRLEPGDIFLAYTDGVTDAQNKAGQAFGKKQLFSAAVNSLASVEELVQHLRILLADHIRSQDQFDDITLLALRRMPEK
jgi:sigma-B regulation protein RsbU (phosphoserine phosphatase)